MNDEKKTLQKPHSMVLNDRRNLSLTGVEEVLDCDEEIITVRTVMGELVINGRQLHIGSFNRGSGDLKIDGVVREMLYADAETERRGFFGRLFR